MLIKDAESVTFVFVPPARRGFRSVAVAGDFNKWNPASGPMAPAPDGSWRTTLTLPPGDYQFRYCADGQWFNDPNADGEVPNQFGGRNCLARIVRPAPAPVPPAPAPSAPVPPAPAPSAPTAVPTPAPAAAPAPVVAEASVSALPTPVAAETVAPPAPVAAETVAPPAPVPPPAPVTPPASVVAEAPVREPPPAPVGTAVAEAAPPRTSAGPGVAIAFRPSATDPVFEDGDDEKPDFSLLFRWNPAKAPAARPKAEAARPKAEARNGGAAGDVGADPLIRSAGEFAAWWGRFNPPEG